MNTNREFLLRTAEFQIRPYSKKASFSEQKQRSIISQFLFAFHSSTAEKLREIFHCSSHGWWSQAFQDWEERVREGSLRGIKHPCSPHLPRGDERYQCRATFHTMKSLLSLSGQSTARQTGHHAVSLPGPCSLLHLSLHLQLCVCTGWQLWDGSGGTSQSKLQGLQEIQPRWVMLGCSPLKSGSSYMDGAAQKSWSRREGNEWLRAAKAQHMPKALSVGKSWSSLCALILWQLRGVNGELLTTTFSVFLNFCVFLMFSKHIAVWRKGNRACSSLESPKYPFPFFEMWFWFFLHFLKLVLEGKKWLYTSCLPWLEGSIHRTGLQTHWLHPMWVVGLLFRFNQQ